MILGNDCSSWQRSNPRTNGDVDFHKMKQAGSNYCFFRAQFGIREDVDYITYMSDSKGILARGAYYYPITQYDIDDQTARFCALLKSDKGEMKPVLDVEKYKGTVHNASQLRNACLQIEAKLGVKPMIYTGYYVWRDDVKGNKSWAKDYDLWIANYGVDKPSIPAPWTDWTFWQTSEGKGRGLEFGVESLDIDMDLYNGDEIAFAKYCDGDIPIPDTPPPQGEFILTATCEMNVRSGPGVRYPRVATIANRATVMPIGIGGSDAWVEIAKDLWVCAKQGDTVYLK